MPGANAAKVELAMSRERMPEVLSEQESKSEAIGAKRKR